MLALTSLTSYAAPPLFSPSFETYLTLYNKTYDTVEIRQRASACWAENAKAAAKLHQENPKVTFGENAFSDLCFDEFSRLYLGATKTGPRRVGKVLQPDAERAALEILESLPSVDWRTSPAVGPIKDQARCGSCWAFGTVANIEAQHYLWATDGTNGTYISLSEQELVSCDHFKDNTGSDQGCNGGFPDRAMQWIMQNDGLVREETYPYTSGDGKTGQCDTSKETPKAVQIFDYHDLGANETYVAAYVAKYGPVVIGLDATSAWQSYKGGVLTQSCAEAQLDHAVVIVGYGTDASEGDYWIIRNSWGESWGESGYVRLKRGVNCNGVVNDVTSALFANRSLCLQECAADDQCCAGDCCPQDSSHTCTPSGCCAAPSVVCPAKGGNECCAKEEYCGGGTCCDPAFGKFLDKNGDCCDADDKCGDVCCAVGPFKTCCPGTHATCADEGDAFVLCCPDGMSCKKNFEQCCAQPDGSYKCGQAPPFGSC